METACVKVRLKEGSIERVREWASELNRRGGEVQETLSEEGVVIESAFLDQTEHGDFLIYYMKAHSFEEARRAVQASRNPIDSYHQRFKQETWASRTSLELLIDFENLG